jgi:hypothetical protein
MVRRTRTDAMTDDPRRRLTLGLALLAAGAAVALIAQFLLDDWASVSQLGDWIQHGAIFWGGVGMGVALVVLRRLSHGPP